MKRRKALLIALLFLIMASSLSSCVSIGKIRYLEPVGDNKADWQAVQTKDSFTAGFYELQLSYPINNATEEKHGLVEFKFIFGHGPRSFFFSIAGDSDNLLRQVDLDSAAVRIIQDSLIKVKAINIDSYTYNKFIINVNDSETIPVKLFEYVTATNHPRVREYRAYAQRDLKKGQKITITTGDPYLDAIFKQYTFILKTKTRLGLMTRWN